MSKNTLIVVATLAMVLTFLLAVPAGANEIGPPQAEQLWSYNTTFDVTDIAVGDVNGDGKDDVASIESVPVNLHLFSGDGPPPLWSKSIEGYAVAVGDITGDGEPEVIAGALNSTDLIAGFAGATPWKLYVYDKDGNLHWSYDVNESVIDIEIGDIDGDGIQDLVACTSSESSLIYAINGTGHDLPGWPLSPGTQVVDLAVGQLDGKGGVDVAGIGPGGGAGCLYVYNSTGVLMWEALTVEGRAVEIGDVDGDGDNEVVAVDYGPGIGFQEDFGPSAISGGWVLAFDGDEGGEPLYSFYTEDYKLISDIELGDLDGNPMDVEIAAITEPINATLFAIDIDSSPGEQEMWSYPIDWSALYYGESLAIGDVDRDYKNEVIAASSAPQHCIYAFDGIDRDGDGQGDLVWAPYCVTEMITDVEIGDLDGDGDEDVVFGTRGGKVYAITAVENQMETATGTGTVYFDSDPSTLEGLTSVAESELPEEGKPDLEFPHGFFSFNITLPEGHTSAIITITFPSNIPAGAQYWKYHEPEGWIDVTSLLGDDDGDNVLTLTINDGGLGDDDGVQNGVIVDQAGPGLPMRPVGGEAYKISTVYSLALWIAVAMLIAGGTLYALRRHRKQS